MHARLPSLALIVFLVAGSAAVAKPAHKKALADFLGPVLAAKLNQCTTCHLPDEGEGGSEKPHNPFGARLAALKTDVVARIETVAGEDSDGDGVANLVELITGHSPGDARDKPAAAVTADAPQRLATFLQDVAKRRWNPYKSVSLPAVPAIKNAAWARNPIDQFLAAEHEARRLTPRGDAPRHVLLRRVYLDLIGLPPTRAEQQTFLADESPDAFEKVVDRLLASPRYGERWGRHWMDVWRYADWAGYGGEVRDSKPHVWRWRDWIVESLNNDKGYDRMVQEMLAGDELEPTNPDTLRATGFLVRNWYKFNRNVWLDNTVEHTAKAFLGVTLNCARCHDHFFDPISQKEYFQFRALFEAYDVRTDRVPGQADVNKDGLARAYDAHLTTPTYLFVRGNEANPDKANVLLPGVPTALGGRPLRVEPVTLPALAQVPDKRDFVTAETLEAAAFAVRNARRDLDQARRTAAGAVASAALSDPWRMGNALRDLEAIRLAEINVSLAELSETTLKAVVRAEQMEDDLASRGSKPSESADWTKTAIAVQGYQRRLALETAKRDQFAAQMAHRQAANDKAKTDAAQKGMAADKALAKAEADLKMPPSTTYTKRQLATYPATSSGRRLALARWIADGQNPLTARVAVNHLWLRHFGKPLVPTVFDFGKNGQAPSHPALLDWLAAEFVRRGWSMKEMHRLMVTSQAYRMDSTPDAACLAADPDNRYLWRMNPRRMEAELVRDSVLYAAGRLDLAFGGPEISHAQGLSVPRRSLYFQHAAEKQVEFLQLFDAASVTECYRRNESIVPQQALALVNSSLSLSQARLLARDLSREAGPSDVAFVRAAFEQVLNRPPTDAEQSECVTFLEAQAALLKDRGKLTGFGAGQSNPVPPADDPSQRARENLTHVLFNHNDFVTIR